MCGALWITRVYILECVSSLNAKLLDLNANLANLSLRRSLNEDCNSDCKPAINVCKTGYEGILNPMSA